MDAVRLIQRLHEHRTWVNQNLLDVCAVLSDEQRERTFPIGQGSIWKSLLHLYAAEYIWLAALLGDEDPVAPGDLPGRLPGNQQAAGGITSFDDLKQKWTDLGDRWWRYLSGLSAADLDDTVYKRSTSSQFGQRLGTSRADVLLHVCTHAQYTTAQIVNMLRHVGVDRMPDAMLITLARQAAMQ